MDGQIIIGTKLDTKQLEQQLKQQEKRLQQYEKEAEKLTTAKSKVEVDLSAYEKEKQLIQERTDANLQFAQTEEQVKNVLGLEQTELDNLNAKYADAFKKNEDINAQLRENARNQAIIRGLIGRTTDELGKSNVFGKIKDMFKDLGKETEKNIKKIGKYVLAIFGIRAVYSFIRNSINTITSNDEQLKADIEYMKTALAYIIEPVVRKIVEWAKVLFQYVAYIIKMWTGNDIFAKADKNLKNADKTAKDIKKQLAGFDEVNIMSDTSSKGSGASTSIKPLGEGETPKWLKWIGEHGKEILAVVGGIVLALTLVKLGVDALIATGIGVAVAGLLLTIMSIIDYLKDPSIENFGKIIIGIGLAVAGVAIAFGAWPVAIGGAIAVVVGLIIANWGKIKKLLDDGLNWLRGIGDTIHNNYGDLIGGIYDMFVDKIELIINFVDTSIKNAKKILDGLIDFVAGIFTGDWDRAWNGIFNIVSGIFGMMIAPYKFVFDYFISTASNTIKTIVNIFSGGFDSIKSAIQGVFNFILKILDLMWSGFKFNLNLIIDGINFLIHGMNKIQWDVPSWVPYIGGQKWGINIPKIPKLAQGGIVDMPNRGVMMSNYIAGESGREAVLPLTDANTMAMLGQEIARYVNINNVIDVNMDSRRINRIMQQSQTSSDFARNV